jgi:hypothetical protein
VEKYPLILGTSARAKALNWIQEERGSLSILSTSLFFLLVLSSFVIMNASSAYLAKRELIQIGEVGITKAVQHLDSNSYYGNLAGGSSSSGNSAGNSVSNTAIPIDCPAAAQSFRNEMAQSNLRQSPIVLNQWSCDGFNASATISSQVRHLLVMPILGSQAPMVVTTEVAARNALQS